MPDLGFPSPSLLGFLLLFLIVFSFFLLFRGAFLWLFFLLLVTGALLPGSGRNIIVSYMAGLPGSLDFLLVLFLEVLKTVQAVGVRNGFLDVLYDLGSDATPMTPRAVVGNVRSFNRYGTVYARDAYNEVLPLISTRVL